MPSNTSLKDTTQLHRLGNAALSFLAVRYPSEELFRVRGFIDHAIGRVPPAFHEHQSSNLQPLHFPGLPAEPFLDPNLFPEAAQLEREFETLRTEIVETLGVTAQATQYEAGASPKWPLWKKVAFYEGGACGRRLEASKAFPKTSELVDHVVRDYPDFLSAGLLIQESQMAIPPHVDWFNVYVSLWLPIVVPPQCGLDVGGEQREIEAGKCIAFDNSYFHSSWNHSSESRVVLAFYRLHPRLTATEVNAFIDLKDAYAHLFFPAS